MQKRNLLYFNLIEIAMALGIIGFGVSAIMSVIPAAMHDAQNSIAEDYSSNAAELFLSYISVESKRTGGWSLITGLPTSDSPPADDVAYTDYKSEDISAEWSGLHESSESGSYLVESGSDYEAVARIWTTELNTGSMEISSTSPGSYSATDTDGVPTIATDEAAGVYVELSWPAIKPYDARNKRVYYRELFKPNQ